MSTFFAYLDQVPTQAYTQYRKLFDPYLAFYSIAGIQQVITSVLIILILLEKIEIKKQYLWVRSLAILLVFNFAFNVVVAVNSSASTTFYNEFFKDALSQLS